MSTPGDVGWYGIRVPHPSGVRVRRTVFCFPGDDGLVCEMEGVLLPVKHARFTGAEWKGPFPTRTHADAAFPSPRDAKGPSEPSGEAGDR